MGLVLSKLGPQIGGPEKNCPSPALGLFKKINALTFQAFWGLGRAGTLIWGPNLTVLIMCEWYHKDSIPYLYIQILYPILGINIWFQCDTEQTSSILLFQCTACPVGGLCSLCYLTKLRSMGKKCFSFYWKNRHYVNGNIDISKSFYLYVF